MRDDQDGPATQCPPIARTDTDKVKNSKWKPVLLPLNPNFLRLTNERNDDFSDEFAVMLQNEEFLAELRWIKLTQQIDKNCYTINFLIRFNQEFLSTLEKEQGRDERNFEERLKHMGKVSRKKFYQLAKIFTFQRKKPSSAKPKNSKLLEQVESEDEEKRK